MAARSIVRLPGITPPRVPEQPKRVAPDDGLSYREVVGDVSATLGLIKQLEPYLAQLGYTQNPAASKARGEVNPQANAQADQVMAAFAPEGQATPGAPAQPIPPRMGAAPMERVGRRAPEASTGKDAALAAFLSELQGAGAAVGQLDTGMQPPPQPGLPQSPVQLTGIPEPVQRPSMAPVDAAIARIQPTTEEGEMARARAQRALDARKAAEGTQAPQQAAAPADGAPAPAQPMQPAQPALQQMTAPPVPTPEEYNASQRAALDLLAEVNPALAADGRQVQQAEQLPRFETFAEAKAAMGAALAAGDADAAAKILKGASFSPLRDVRPTGFVDRISGAHIQRAIGDLAADARGLASLSLRVRQAEAIERHRAQQLEQRERQIAHREKVDTEKQRVADEKLKLSEQDLYRRSQESIARIEKMELDGALKQQMQGVLIRLRESMRSRNFADAARSYALAKTLNQTLPGKVRKQFMDEVEFVGQLGVAAEEAKEAGLDVADAPTSLEDAVRSMGEGKRVAPKAMAGSAVARKKAVDSASIKATERVVGSMFGLPAKGGDADKIPARDKQSLATIQRMTRSFVTPDGAIDGSQATRAMPAIRAEIDNITDARTRKTAEAQLKAMVARLSPAAWKAYQDAAKGK
jgi:hypothetical protein